MEWYFALPLAIIAGFLWVAREYIIGYIFSPSKEEDDTKS